MSTRRPLPALFRIGGIEPLGGLALLALSLVLLAGLAGCAQGPAAGALPLSGVLALDAPGEAPAGAPLLVTVARRDAPDGTLVTLVATGSYGPRIHRAAFSRGEARLLLSAEDTARSGVVTLTGMAGEARGWAEVRLLPGPAAEPLVPLVGARSIIADAAHWSMVVVAPTDGLHNPVADGTPVRVRALHPGDRLEELTVPVRHLLAWARLYSGTQAGRTTISVEAQGAHGPEATLLEVPGWPLPFAVTVAPGPLAADGRQLMTLRSAVLQDQFGNVVPDGTLVAFVVHAPDGTQRFITAPTLAGVAEAPLQAPGGPGALVVTGSIYGIRGDMPSVEAQFSAGPAVGEFPVAVRRAPARGAITFRAGPLLGPLGQYAPDGTLVAFLVTGPDGVAFDLSGLAQDGYAAVDLRTVGLAPGGYSVRATAGSGQGAAQFTIP